MAHLLLLVVYNEERRQVLIAHHVITAALHLEKGAKRVGVTCEKVHLVKLLYLELLHCFLSLDSAGRRTHLDDLVRHKTVLTKDDSLHRLRWPDCLGYRRFSVLGTSV